MHSRWKNESPPPDLLIRLSFIMFFQIYFLANVALQDFQKQLLEPPRKKFHQVASNSELVVSNYVHFCENICFFLFFLLNLVFYNFSGLEAFQGQLRTKIQVYVQNSVRGLILKLVRRVLTSETPKLI